jgi:hypothetical protein
VRLLPLFWLFEVNSIEQLFDFETDEYERLVINDMCMPIIPGFSEVTIFSRTFSVPHEALNWDWKSTLERLHGGDKGSLVVADMDTLILEGSISVRLRVKEIDGRDVYSDEVCVPIPRTTNNDRRSIDAGPPQYVCSPTSQLTFRISHRNRHEELVKDS